MSNEFVSCSNDSSTIHLIDIDNPWFHLDSAQIWPMSPLYYELKNNQTDNWQNKPEEQLGEHVRTLNAFEGTIEITSLSSCEFNVDTRRNNCTMTTCRIAWLCFPNVEPTIFASARSMTAHDFIEHMPTMTSFVPDDVLIIMTERGSNLTRLIRIAAIFTFDFFRSDVVQTYTRIIRRNQHLSSSIDVKNEKTCAVEWHRRSYFEIVRIHRFDASDFTRLASCFSWLLSSSAVLVGNIQHSLDNENEHIDENKPNDTSRTCSCCFTSYFNESV
jgi:hypothetical protein